MQTECGRVRLGISGHVPGQEFFDAAERIIVDAVEHLAQPAFRIDAVEAGPSCSVVDSGSKLLAWNRDLAPK